MAIYLTVAGQLSQDEEKLELETGFAFEAPEPEKLSRQAVKEERAVAKRRHVAVELIGREGRVLEIQRLALVELCGDGGVGDEGTGIVGRLRIPPQTRAIRYLLDKKVVLDVEVPKEGPRVGVDPTPPRSAKGRYALSWDAEHPDGLPLSFIVCMSTRARPEPQPITLPVSETKAAIDLDALPGGRVKLSVMASDGFNTIVAEGPELTLERRGVTGVITSPEPNERLSHRRVVLTGQGLDLDNQRPILDGLVWRSSKDGELGKGRVLEAELSTGKHEISLHQADTEEPLSKVTVTVRGRSLEDEKPPKPKPRKPRPRKPKPPPRRPR